MSDATPTVADHRGVAAGAARRLVRLTDDRDLAIACRAGIAGLEDAGAADVVIGRLATALGLSPFECDVAATIGLPEEHEAFTALARRLHPLGEPRLSYGAIAAALDLDHGGRHHLRLALGAGPLTRYGVVVATSAAPEPERGWRLGDHLWDVVRGADRWPDALRPGPEPPCIPGAFPSDRLVGALGERPAIVVVSGAAGRSAEELATHAYRAVIACGRRAVVFDAAVLAGDHAALATVHLIARGAVPIAVGASDRAVLPEHPRPVVVCAPEAVPVPLDDRPVVEISAPARSLSDDVEMWRAVAPELDGDAERVAGLLRVDPLRAARAVGDARAAAAAGAPGIDTATLVRRVRRRSDRRLPPSVHRVSPQARRDRLVTSADNEALLCSITDRVRGQVRVLHEWGFAAVGGNRGVRALFSGPPGTGKTLSAEITAHELGLDLLTVDLSALVSKWLGETEKNIGEVFDAAEHCQAVLFFDEADAIFGRRTDASDAQARWANLETAYLLSRIDAFDGLVMLATNLRANIDGAFLRRLDVVVEFDEPGPRERIRLWRAHLPALAPVAADVDLDQLAALYPVTGGLIRNAALSAAFHAAERGIAIDQRALVDAVCREYQKTGRSFPGAPRELAGARSGGS